MFLAVIALGVLIIVHELGHYVAAKLCGVHVERFSIGFGPKLWSKTRGETEYCLSAIPLGGYVKLHRMTEYEEVVEGKESQAFFNKSYYKKIVVIIAGVFFNLLFAILLFAAVLIVGYRAYSPIVGVVSEGKAADRAGFLSGDRITDVNGKYVRSWEEFLIYINEQKGVFTVEVERDGNNVVLSLLPDETNYINPLGGNEVVSEVGMSVYIESLVGGLTPYGPAEKAGIKKGDRFVSINNENIGGWQDVVRIVRASPETPLSIVMLRNGAEYHVDVTPSISGNVGKLGVISSYGDIILRDRPLAALRFGAEQTIKVTGLIYKGIWQLLSGKVSRDNIGGPILILKETANSAKDGLDSYLNFIALISINLAVLNLLPMPILDGGYVLIYTYECVTRRRISASAQTAGRMIGFALLCALMILAFYNDIMRFFNIM